MKKIVLSILTLIILSVVVTAQVEPHAIGVRLGGGNYGGGFEASYQHGFGDANRLELDLGLNSHNSASYTSIAGIYQWVWAIDQGFNWYAGPGAQLFLYSGGNVIGVGGDIGIEYNFNEELDTPLLISIDTRPMFNLHYYSGGDRMGWAAALSIRYTF